MLILKLILDAKDQRLTVDQIFDNLMQDPPFSLNRFEIRFQFDALLDMNAIERREQKLDDETETFYVSMVSQLDVE